MPPTDTGVELTKAIISALPAAALAVLFAIFAVMVIVLFMRFIERQSTQFVSAMQDEGTRNRQAQAEQAQRWRDDFSAGMMRFAHEMGQVNQNVQAMASALGSHDSTMQIGMAGLTNAIQTVSKAATGPLAEKK